MPRVKKVDFAITDELLMYNLAEKYTRRLIMCPDFWTGYTLPYNPNKFKWIEKKMFVEVNSKFLLNPELETINKNIGGIYMFIIKTPLLASFTNYLMYIGKVESSSGYGINNRMKSYYSGSYAGPHRLNIKILFDRWKDHIYVAYAPIGKNQIIKNIEDSLINAIVPPVNSAMGSTEMQRVQNAW